MVGWISQREVSSVWFPRTEWAIGRLYDVEACSIPNVRVGCARGDRRSVTCGIVDLTPVGQRGSAESASTTQRNVRQYPQEGRTTVPLWARKGLAQGLLMAVVISSVVEVLHRRLNSWCKESDCVYSSSHRRSTPPQCYNVIPICCKGCQYIR